MSIKYIKKQLKRYNLFEFYLNLYRTGKTLQNMDVVTLMDTQESIDRYKYFRDLSVVQWETLKSEASKVKNLTPLNNGLFKYLMVGYSRSI